MRLLITGDWHLRWKAPRWRRDDYFKAQQQKILQIFDIVDEEKCSVILQPGDFFDSHDTPAFVIAKYIKWLKKWNSDGLIKLFAVRGQHDLRYHSKNTDNTPLAIMEAAGVLDILRDDEGHPLAHNIYLYGCHWNTEEIPTSLDDPADIKILLMHKMVIKDKKLWPGQDGYLVANHFLKNHPFDLIVTGDNHKSFMVEKKGRYLVNCGSLMRSGIDQVDHQPVVYVYDTDDKSLKSIPLNIKPVEEVFDIDGVDKQIERDEKMDAFIDGMKLDTEDFGLDFLANLRGAMSDTKYVSAKKIIDDFLEKMI